MRRPLKQPPLPNIGGPGETSISWHLKFRILRHRTDSPQLTLRISVLLNYNDKSSRCLNWAEPVDLTFVCLPRCQFRLSCEGCCSGFLSLRQAGAFARL
jgi:hypothetical protein